MYWKTIWIPQILGAVFGGVFVFRLGRSKTPEILLHAMEEFTGMIRESKGYTGWAEKTERKLIRNGAKYHFGKTITPMKYLTGRIVLAFLGGDQSVENRMRIRCFGSNGAVFSAGTAVDIYE